MTYVVPVEFFKTPWRNGWGEYSGSKKAFALVNREKGLSCDYRAELDAAWILEDVHTLRGNPIPAKGRVWFVGEACDTA